MADRKLWFVHFAQWASHITGRPLTFMLALASIVVWAMLGPFFGFSDTWQLVINTATTIITFLMVFVIQNTQNRDTAAMHIKIDELIRVTQKARNVLLDLEELDDKTLELLRKDYEKLARKAKSHTSTPIRAEEVPGSRESRKPARARPQMSETDKPGSIEAGLKAEVESSQALLRTCSDQGRRRRRQRYCSTARRCARLARHPSSCRPRRWRKRSPRNGAGRASASIPRPCRSTRLANSVIDGVKGNEGAVLDDILKYAGSDLLCYRAEGPKGLVALQTKHWDPILAWAKHDLGAPMRLSEGVMHVEQPPTSLDALRERLHGFDPCESRRAPRHDRAFRLGAACACGRAGAAHAGGGLGGRPCR